MQTTATAFKPLSINAHAVGDILLTLPLLLAPFVFGYAGNNLPALYTWGLYLTAVGSFVITKYPLGILRILPMKWHIRMELGAVTFMAIMTWLFFPDVPGLMGVVLFVMIGSYVSGLLTDTQ